MADYVEKWGDDVESAVELALKEMKLTRDEVTYTVIEEPSKGFLGLFNKKLAKVRVEKKKNSAKTENKQDKDFKAGNEKAKDAFSTKSDFSVKKEDKPEKTVSEPEKTVAPAETAVQTENIKEPENHSDNNSFINNEEQKTTDEDAVKKAKPPASYMHTKFAVNESDEGAVPAQDEPAVKFIEEMAVNMGLEVQVKANMLEEILYINLEGKGVGTMIGKRGQTLDAIQYLTSIVENKNSENHVRVIVNAENYREKREKTLQQLAKRLADKCIKSGRNVRLEPMSPYERKVIHSTLQANPKVTTRSEGIEPNRRVVIESARR